MVLNSLLEGDRSELSVEKWLQQIRQGHSQEIDLSLERTAEVAARLGVLHPSCPVITVAGTNGKGSCVSAIEQIAMAGGYKTGAFTTPFIWRYNEQIRLQGEPVSDSLLSNAFHCVDKARHACSIAQFPIGLTPFEFGTLAALWIFKHANIDLWILEVGMGGRFDAVNVIDADVAVVASIDIDHAAWLGNTRELIAREKAGIFRVGKPAIYGDENPPHTLVDYANALDTPVFFQGKDFYFLKQAEKNTWNWYCNKKENQKKIYQHLPMPSILLQNASTALMAIDCLESLKEKKISKKAIKKAFTQLHIRARIELIKKNNKNYILDVAHNPAAIKKLSEYLAEHPIKEKTIAVFSMLADKDITNSIKIISDQIDGWHVAKLQTERAASRENLIDIFNKLSIKNTYFYESIDAAAQAAEAIKEVGRIVLFGSFHTVSEGFCDV